MRYTVDDYQQSLFYQLPKYLCDNEKYKNKLSNNAKVLYALLRDRHSLSMSNKDNWIDDDGFVFLRFTRIAMADMLGVSEPTAKKAFEELVSFGLISEERLGQGKANRIYLEKIEITSVDISDNCEKESEEKQEEVLKDFQNQSNFSSRKKDNMYSKTKGSSAQEPKEVLPNNTKYNNTYLIKSNHIISYHERELIRRDFENQINYLALSDMQDVEEKELDNLVDICVDVLSSTQKTIRVSKEERDSEVVKSAFGKLGQYELYCLILDLKNTSKRMIRAKPYLTTALYERAITHNVNCGIKGA